MSGNPAWAKEILDFWFSMGEKDWFGQNAQTDKEIRQYQPLWEVEKDKPVGVYTDNPDLCLAAILLFDQFPRNLFRDSGKAFATDDKALTLAKHFIAKGWDENLPKEKRLFVYVPYQHSENMQDQERSLELFKQLGFSNAYEFSKKHYDVIKEFGRFPHRNEKLGRASTPAEEKTDIGENW